MARRRRAISFDNTRSVMNQIFEEKAAKQQALLNHVLQMQRQQELQAGQAKLQEADDERNLLQTILSNPQLAMRLRRSGRSQVNNVPIDSLIQTEAERAGPLFQGLAGAKNLSELQTEDELRGLAGAQELGPPTIEQLIAARLARQGSLTEEANLANPTAVNVPDPATGAVQTTYHGARTLPGKTFQTGLPAERAGELAGLKDKTQALGGALSPEVIAAEARKAGRVSGAQTSAQQSAFLSPGFVNARVDEHNRKAQGSAAASGANGTQTQQTIMQMGTRMVELANSLNTKDSRFMARVGGAGMKAEDVTGIDFFSGQPGPLQDNFHELEALRQGFTSVLLKKLGRVGTPTENDEKRTRAIMPSWGLTPEENASTNKNFLAIIAKAEQLGSQFGPIDQNLPIAQQEAETQRRLQLLGVTPNELVWDGQNLSPGR